MGGQIILVVEDEVLIRMMLADVLRDDGYQVIEAVCGDEGMDILRSGQNIDLIITDVRMPGLIDGVELTARAKALDPGLPVVVVSAHLPPASASGADVFIAKPYVPSMLLKAVYNLIGPSCQNPSQNRNAL